MKPILMQVLVAAMVVHFAAAQCISIYDGQDINCANGALASAALDGDCHTNSYQDLTASIEGTVANDLVSAIIYSGRACSGDSNILATYTKVALPHCRQVQKGSTTVYVTVTTADCPSGSKSKCFPANATVLLESGETKPMADVRVGDSVLAAPGVFSKVYMFSHRLAETNSAFVTLTTDAGAELQLTQDHYLYVNGVLATAGAVRVGDALTLASGVRTTVTAVNTMWAAGLYNPHTLHGDIVVNGIATSTYTKAIAPAIAHAALWPVRALYAAGVQIDDDAFASGSEMLTAVMPKGADKY